MIMILYILLNTDNVQYDVVIITESEKIDMAP